MKCRINPVAKDFIYLFSSFVILLLTSWNGAGWLIDLVGSRYVMCSGFGLQAVGILCLQFGYDNTMILLSGGLLGASSSACLLCRRC